MRLARSPESIVIGDVVRDFEEGFDLVECFNTDTCDCRIQPACVLKGTLDEALDAFPGVLERMTLADLLVPRRRLRTLLAIGQGETELRRATSGTPAWPEPPVPKNAWLATTAKLNMYSLYIFIQEALP